MDTAEIQHALSHKRGQMRHIFGSYVAHEARSEQCELAEENEETTREWKKQTRD